ncbi:MAG: hypothetical protein IT177_08600 [Acidobacteria bacterium]|nr:hypothetical protein [Acidobacteriota bacterium]
MKKLLVPLVVMAVVVPGVIAGIIFYIDHSQTRPTAARTPPPSAHQGAYGAFQFTYTSQGDSVVATFTPMLPADDATVLGAVRAVAGRAFGVDLTNSATRLEGREIALSTPNGVFYAMLVKQDTGQVHSIRIRR